MKKSLGRLALMFALMGAAAVPSTAFTQTFADTDGDGINDAVETPACVGDNGSSRGGFIDSRGCTGEFFACVAAQPKSYYTCGSPESWDNLAVRGYLDAMDFVVDAHGRPYYLDGDHMPQWDRGKSEWTCPSGHVSVLHRGSKAFSAGRKPVETGLPSQTPPFCHPDVIRVDRVGGTDATARADAKSALDTADRLAKLLDDADTGYAATRKVAVDTAAAVNDRRTGLGATRATANRLALLIDDEDRGFVATRKVAEDTAAAVNDELTGLDATRETADATFLEVHNTDRPIGPAGVVGNGIPDDSRIDRNEERSQEAVAGVEDLRGKEVVLGVGYNYLGFGYINDDWSRPQLHGPRLEVGFRRTFPAWIMMIRAVGTPYAIKADGFTVGGNVGALVRLPKAVGLSVGGDIGASMWSAGAYAPGSQGYAKATGGGLDIDALLWYDIPGKPFTIGGFVGLRVHGVKVVDDRDPVIVDFAGGGSFQFRL